MHYPRLVVLCPGLMPAMVSAALIALLTALPGAANPVATCAVMIDDQSGSSTYSLGCGCVNDDGPTPDWGHGGSGTASGSIWAKMLPGTLCHMNVGNTGASNGAKIDTCAHLLGRASEVSGTGCDTITLVELLSSFQCVEICDEDPESDACKLCEGCGSNVSPLGCRNQAALVCPPEEYEINCTEAPLGSVGCDCICTKKGPCAAQGPDCDSDRVTVDDLSWTDTGGESHPCSSGNYAHCTRCTDPYGGPSTGHCVVHPDHCNYRDDPVLGTFLLNAANRALCLATCSTELMNRAQAEIAGMTIQSMTGDFNCIPRGQTCSGTMVTIAECPWLSSSNTFGAMSICPQTDHSAAVGIGQGSSNCMLDFVLSNHCGCSSTSVVPAPSVDPYGDHRTIIFGQSGQPVIETVPYTSHRQVHGNFTVQLASGGTANYSYGPSNEDVGPLGFACGANAGCNGSTDLGPIIAWTEACEARHQARASISTGCMVPGKALLCETAGAWAWSSGQGNGHGAETADTASASASSQGNQWQARCNTRKRIVDMNPFFTLGVLESVPFDVLANADASCTRPLTPPSPVEPTEPGFE